MERFKRRIVVEILRFTQNDSKQEVSDKAGTVPINHVYFKQAGIATG